MAAPLLARHPCSARHGGAIRAREQTVPGLHPCKALRFRWLKADSRSTVRAAAISFESDAEVREPSSNGTPPEEIPFQIPHQLLQAPMFQPGTIAVHGGEREGRPRVSDSLTTPIVQTSTYTFRNTSELLAYQEGTYGSYEYGRYGNPTSRTCEEKIRSLEEAEDCLVSTSGMNSATTLLLALVPAGGHIVTTTDCYRRTRQFIQTLLPKMGITATVLDPSDLAGLEHALNTETVSLFFSESPTNPYLRCVDIPKIAELCHAKGALVVIDSTFATPINQRAISLGADLVLHSATKYLAGHNDVLAGAVAGRADLVAAVRSMHNVLGGVIDPHAAYLLLRGMKTLDLRVERHNRSAMLLAQRLQEHSKVRKVHYPGLESHCDHAIAKAQMDGYGGVVSFEIEGGLWETAKFIDTVKLPYIAPSLGGVESLIEQPTIVSYWDQGEEMRKFYGIKDNLVRFSVGIESVEDVWADLKQALDQVKSGTSRRDLAAIPRYVNN